MELDCRSDYAGHDMGDDLAKIPIENRWRNQELPAAIVISIIRRLESSAPSDHESAFLLIKRLDGPYRDYWALVGGKWDFGESLSKAALREIEEETGLDGTFVSLLGIVNERARIESGEDLGGAHFLLFVCMVDSMNGEAEEREEGAVAWFSREDIEQLNDSDEIIPSDYAMLSHFMGETALPYVEAEMASADVNDVNLETTKLIRFEVST